MYLRERESNSGPKSRRVLTKTLKYDLSFKSHEFGYWSEWRSLLGEFQIFFSKCSRS